MQIQSETGLLDQPAAAKHADVFAPKSRVHFVVPSSQSSFAVQICVELLNLANKLSNQTYYMPVVHRDFSDVFQRRLSTEGQTVVLFGSIDDRWPLTAEMQKLLRIHLPCTSRIGLVGGAVLIAADIQFLRARTVSVHPDMSRAAAEGNLNIQTGDQPVCRDRNVFSAIGGLAAPEMIKEMIAEDLGAFMADRVMDYVGLNASGTGRRTQQENQYFQRAKGDAFLMQAIDVMVANIETTLSSRALAQRLNISSRQLERVFRRTFSESPMEVYRNLRLERADQLLRYSDIPVFEVSLATGFGSVSLLSQRYRERYGRKPSETRAGRYGG
ncbi:MAG: helix-turn-helix domain-containing protein [Halocynthiibacter sp.]